MDCYVYYKANVKHEQEIITSFHQLRESFKKVGIAPLLQRRPESRDSMHTWMEIYTEIPSDFDTIAETFLTESGMKHFIVGERHVERFIRIELSQTISA